MDDIWPIITVVGPIILGVALIWAILNNRRTPREEARTEAATRANYEAENAADKNGRGERL